MNIDGKAAGSHSTSKSVPRASHVTMRSPLTKESDFEEALAGDGDDRGSE